MITQTRCCLTTVNIIFIIMGLVGMALGGLLYLDTNVTTPLLESWARPHLALQRAGPPLGVAVTACGLVVFVVSMCGCIGSLVDVRNALVLYSLSQLILIATELFVVVFLSTSDGNSKSFLERSLEVFLRNYNETNDHLPKQSSPTSVRRLFIVFECCGINDFTDYSTQRLSWTRDPDLRPPNSTTNYPPLACCKQFKVSGASSDEADRTASPPPGGIVATPAISGANSTFMFGAIATSNTTFNAGAQIGSDPAGVNTSLVSGSNASSSVLNASATSGSVIVNKSLNSDSALDVSSSPPTTSRPIPQVTRNDANSGQYMECLVHHTAATTYLEGCLEAIRQVLDSLRGWIVVYVVTSVLLKVFLAALAVKQCLTEDRHKVYEQIHVGQDQPVFDTVTERQTDFSSDDTEQYLEQYREYTHARAKLSVLSVRRAKADTERLSKGDNVDTPPFPCRPPPRAVSVDDFGAVNIAPAVGQSQPLPPPLTAQPAAAAPSPPPAPGIAAPPVSVSAEKTAEGQLLTSSGDEERDYTTGISSGSGKAWAKTKLSLWDGSGKGMPIRTSVAGSGGSLPQTIKSRKHGRLKWPTSLEVNALASGSRVSLRGTKTPRASRATQSKSVDTLGISRSMQFMHTSGSRSVQMAVTALTQPRTASAAFTSGMRRNASVLRTRSVSRVYPGLDVSPTIMGTTAVMGKDAERDLSPPKASGSAVVSSTSLSSLFGAEKSPLTSVTSSSPKPETPPVGRETVSLGSRQVGEEKDSKWTLGAIFAKIFATRGFSSTTSLNSSSSNGTQCDTKL